MAAMTDDMERATLIGEMVAYFSPLRGAGKLLRRVGRLRVLRPHEDEIEEREVEEVALEPTEPTANSDPIGEAVLNIFCPTGPGGGVNPTCGKAGSVGAPSPGVSSELKEAARALREQHPTPKLLGPAPAGAGRPDLVAKSPALQEWNRRYDEYAAAKKRAIVAETVDHLLNGKPPKPLLEPDPTASKGKQRSALRKAKEREEEAEGDWNALGPTFAKAQGEVTASHPRGVEAVEVARGIAEARYTEAKAQADRHRTAYQSAKGKDLGGSLGEAVANIFCPTGPGGGVDPHCGKGGPGSPAVMSPGPPLPSKGTERRSPNEPRSLRTHSEALATKVTDEERAAVMDYTEGGYNRLNDQLRASRGDPRVLGAKERQLHDRLNSVLQKAGDLPEPMIVYRGIRLGYKEEEQLKRMAEEAIRTGRPLELPGFQSTSTGTSIPYDFGDTVFEIKAKRGAPLGSMTSKPGEGEVLLAGGAFKVVGIEENGVFQGKRQTRTIIQLEQQ